MRSAQEAEPVLAEVLQHDMQSLTPVLFVDTIEPCLDFWKRLGFERTSEVPGRDGLVFVSLEKDAVEVMYQTRQSLDDDLPAIVGEPAQSYLFVEVADLDSVLAALDGAFEVIVARRTTSYGAEEYGVREPGGNVVTFAQFADTAQE